MAEELTLDISFGKSRSETKWKTEYLSWPEFVERLRKSRRTTPETAAQYDAMSKADQGDTKDGTCFVGGLVVGGRRKKESVQSRSLVTLDADFADEHFALDVDLILGGTAYIIYSTHSYRPDRHKYRLIVPLSRAANPDEYAATSRKLAEQIGMSYWDSTTFDVHRLMYTPSNSKDIKPVFEVYEGGPLVVDDVLAKYKDWTDITAWPRHKDDKAPVLSGTRVQDPREKQGTIGLFCRAYTIEEGIDSFLADVYSEGTMKNRYTYSAGTSGNGLEVYTDQGLAFSHQDSDPVADGRTYNLFDLVRVHKFGHLDDNVKAFTPDNKRPSHLAMEHFAVAQPEVKRLKMGELADAFGDMGDEPAADDDGEPDAEPDWEARLDLHSKTGLPLPTAANVELILSHGPFAGVLAYDEFGNSEVIRGALPWRGRDRGHKGFEPWLGSDDDRRDHWFDKAHGIRSAAVIKKAFTEVTRKNRFHPIKSYVESFQWDGQTRAENIFIDYLGAADTHYVKQATRKMLLAAVSRLYRPGCKFDQMLVLVGPQGAGKSSLLSKLGRDWFSDSLRTFENKEAGEHLQSGWIFEIGELSAMKKTEVEEVKAFLSKTEDRYRVAFDRVVSDFPRKCIFFGTTNTKDFLRDPSGNRRFWPVEVEPANALLDHWEHLTEADVGQIWAEVVTWYKAGESLQLDDEARADAESRQAAHMETDPREGMIEEWLDGDELDELDRPTGQKRQRVCASMIWTECYGKRTGDMKSWDAKEIVDLMRRIPEWIERKSRTRVPGYGYQTVFERVNSK